MRVCGVALEQAAQRLRELERGAQVAGCACDVRDVEQCHLLAAFAVAAFGRIDIWVNSGMLCRCSWLVGLPVWWHLTR